ncbi:kinase-like domain-containing protein [Chytriomyces cf. hyalinus JEL632]|nr:kinase-like domain-containing protein [Chytriomyces cf. hyalinus JEL632]
MLAINNTNTPLQTATQLHFTIKQSPLYDGLSSDTKARTAVRNAFTHSPAKMHRVYSIARVIGFGSNGVVLAARAANGTPVAIKIIYKEFAGKMGGALSEIEVLKYLSRAGHSAHLLNMVDHWEDSHHNYIVTELFGSDWSQASDAQFETLEPVTFRSRFSGKVTEHKFPFSAGSSDLWSWQHAHRSHMQNTEGHSLLPIEPVKQIIKQVAMGLQSMHAKGFYHADVKIENILVQSASSDAMNSTSTGVKLADFGHARHFSHGIRNYGTAQLQAPEFLSDSPFSSMELDGRAADVFALGMVLYALLSENGYLPSTAQALAMSSTGYESLMSSNGGYYPFDAIADLDHHDEAWGLLNGMCRVDPAQRFTMDQVLAHPWLSD